jgi:hypothetical protein
MHALPERQPQHGQGLRQHLSSDHAPRCVRHQGATVVTAPDHSALGSDMARAHMALLESLNVHKAHALVGASLGTVILPLLPLRLVPG